MWGRIAILGCAVFLITTCRKEDPFQIECLEAFEGEAASCAHVDTSLVSGYLMATLRDKYHFCWTNYYVKRIGPAIYSIDSPYIMGPHGHFAHGLQMAFQKTGPYFIEFQLITPMYHPDTPVSKIFEDMEAYIESNDGYLPIGDRHSFDSYYIEIFINCTGRSEDVYYKLYTVGGYSTLTWSTPRIDSLLDDEYGKGYHEKKGVPNWDAEPPIENDQYKRWLRITRFKKEEHLVYTEYDITFEFKVNLFIYENIPHKEYNEYGYYGPLEGTMRVQFRIAK